MAGQPVNEPNPATQAKLEGNEEPVPSPVTPQAEQPVPAPAPAEPPAPAPAAIVPATGITLDAPAAPAPAQVVWEPTGNDTLDTVGALFAQKGVDGAVAMAEYNASGEIAKETYDDMVSKMGKETADLAFNQFKVAHAELKTAAEADAVEIYKAVGGQEQFEQVKQWSQNLEDGVKAEYNKLFAAGGIAAQLAAKDLQGKMMADPNFKSRADLIGSGNNAPAGGQPTPVVMMDRKTYGAAIQKAEMRGDQAAIDALRTQAGVAMKQNPYWKIGNP